MSATDFDADELLVRCEMVLRQLGDSDADAAAADANRVYVLKQVQEYLNTDDEEDDDA